MELRSRHNGGTVEVDSDFGQRLLDGGGWEVVDEPTPEPEPTPAPTKPPTRRTRRTAPAEEPKTQE